MGKKDNAGPQGAANEESRPQSDGPSPGGANETNVAAAPELKTPAQWAKAKGTPAFALAAACAINSWKHRTVHVPVEVPIDEQTYDAAIKAAS